MPRPRHIYDDVHGLVELDDHEMALVDSPWFQRLRRIHQLGLANMVFPGAEQTRFAHSIGVLHLAGRIAARFETHLRSDEDVRELRAAALLHDVGHFPFSHTLESVYRQAEDAARTPPEQWAEPKTAQALPASDAAKVRADSAEFHERFSQRIVENTGLDNGITTILTKCGDLRPTNVGKLIVAQHENVLLNQIIKSDLDVDKLDYLLRDAKATGSSYGQYDLNYLLECLDVAYLDGTPMLCVTMQGLHPLEHYVLARYYYYLCILYHKTRCMAEGMLQAIVEKLIDANLFPSWETVQDDVRTGEFCGFDDPFVWATLRELADDERLSCEVREAIDALAERRLPKLHSQLVRLTKSRDLPRGIPYGRRQRDIWNPVVGRGVDLQSCQDFRVLEGRLRTKTQDELHHELLHNPSPIRILVRDAYRIPKAVPGVPAQDENGQPAGRLVLLESLKDSVVARLAGQTTHIARTYRPS